VSGENKARSSSCREATRRRGDIVEVRAVDASWCSLTDGRVGRRGRGVWKEPSGRPKTCSSVWWVAKVDFTRWESEGGWCRCCCRRVMLLGRNIRGCFDKSLGWCVFPPEAKRITQARLMDLPKVSVNG